MITIFRARPDRSRVLPAALGTVLLAMAACGDDDAEASAPNADRYCEILAELDAEAQEVFGALAEDATMEEFDEAQAQFVAATSDRFDDLVEAAPPEIADDLRLVVDTVLSGAEAEEDEAASQRVSAFDASTCGSEGTPDP